MLCGGGDDLVGVCKAESWNIFFFPSNFAFAHMNTTVELFYLSILE